MDVARRLYWLPPALICLAAFSRGLFCWFQQDDFAFLRLEVYGWEDLGRHLFLPQAQGVIRPLSGTLFFVVLRRLFGWNAFPYHLLVFLTQLANLGLMAAVVRKLTGARSAAVAAVLVWGLNSALAAPMTWAAAYNQILCSFFYLAAFLMFLRHVETGYRSYYYWQVGLFLTGFGALETMAAYPAALLVYCLLRARGQAWKAAVLLLPSAGYAALHLWGIERDPAGPYVPRLDWGVLGALWHYWSRVLGGALVAVAVLSGGLAAALLRARRGQRGVALFGLGWFALTLAPVLPLGSHRLDYYLTVPAMGLAMAVGALLPGVPRMAAVLWLGVYFAVSVPLVVREAERHYRRSVAARRLIEGAVDARRLHPDKTILLTGVDDSLFYGAVYHQGLRAAGVRNIYLAPTSEGISTQPGLSPVADYRLGSRATLGALARDQAVVYEVAGGRLQNITNRYKALAPVVLEPEAPRRVDAGAPAMAPQLGPGWHQIEGDHRWMGRRAEVRLAAPRSERERLRIRAFYGRPASLGPVELTVSVGGVVVGRVLIRDDRTGEHTFALPAAARGEEMTVTLETDRTFRVPGDSRDLGLAFGVIELVR